MKHVFFILFLLGCLSSFGQKEEFQLQGQVVDANKKPISDAYLFNTRNSDKNVSRINGVFDLRVLPGDTIIIMHISYLRKSVKVFDLLVNPTVTLEMDTINIRQINVTSSQRNDYDRAMENIKRIEFNMNPLNTDINTDAERMQQLLNKENQVMRVQASSLSFMRFSPSEQIGKWIDKRKKRKEANQFSSTKEQKEK